MTLSTPDPLILCPPALEDLDLMTQTKQAGGAPHTIQHRRCSHISPSMSMYFQVPRMSPVQSPQSVLN